MSKSSTNILNNNNSGKMTPEINDQIKQKVLRSLEGTRYAVGSLEPLSGGIANFMYRGDLLEPLEDGVTKVAIKHGEGFVATNSSFKLPLDRCKVEEACLKTLADFRITGTQDSVKYTVTTPKCYFYDEASNTQILEFLPNGIDLKNYVLTNFSSPTPLSYRPHFQQLGKELAQWIIGFHRKADEDAGDASKRGEKSELYAGLENCGFMQDLKFKINYDWLIESIESFPDVLEEARECFEEFRSAAQEDRKGDLMPIHGDFWTGNIVIGNAPLQKGSDIPLFVVDWEMAHLGHRYVDFGQMLAEMYAIWQYRKMEAGLWLVQGFCQGLNLEDENLAFRIAAQVGCHLVACDAKIPSWGTPDQQEECARAGRDFIVHARKRERDWFDESDLACLFARV